MKISTLIFAFTLSFIFHNISAAQERYESCASLPHNDELATALREAVKEENGGLNLNMWATIVNRDGIVCAVAYSGAHRSAQWPGSRVISAQKAYTANAFSLDRTSASNESGKRGGLALSTANLYSAVQPGGSLYGLQHSNPVDTAKAYRGDAAHFGTENDPMVGERVGGINVFGGGLALYDAKKNLIGGLGVSGDTSCADHFIAWRLRAKLNLDQLSTIGGVANDPMRPDNIIFDIHNSVSVSGFGHPNCPNPKDQKALPKVR